MKNITQPTTEYLRSLYIDQINSSHSVHPFQSDHRDGLFVESASQSIKLDK